jgi:hypothetical protein
VIYILYAVVGTLAALASLYFAWRSRGFRKFLAGAFFVSAGVLFYLYLADVSVPLCPHRLIPSSCSNRSRAVVTIDPEQLFRGIPSRLWSAGRRVTAPVG